MTFVDEVLQAPSPKHAIKQLAEAIEDLTARISQLEQPKDAWDAIEWAEPAEPRSSEWLEVAQDLARSNDKAIEIIEADDAVDIVLAGPTPERKEARRQFEQQHLHLSENLGTEEDWTEVYALGGPLWFYHGNRELFMSYPYGTRAAMVQEVEQDDPQAAHEMARDVLKQPCEDGPGGIAMGTDEQVKPHQRIYAS